jgi:hypothetical protein
MTNDLNTAGITPLTDAASKIGSVATGLRNAASQRFAETVTELHSQADDAKTNVAGEVKDVAPARRRASKELRGGSAQKRTPGQIATGPAAVADAMRTKDRVEILQTASKFARDNPVLFLGGAALLGLVASRYAKAWADHAQHAASPPTQHGKAFGFVDATNRALRSDGAGT